MNSDIDVGYFEQKRTDGRIDLVKYEKRLPSSKAKLAMQLVARWGLVTVAIDGEDSAGRQKVRLESPVELVHRACTTADLLIDEINNRGWFLDVPTPDV